MHRDRLLFALAAVALVGGACGSDRSTAVSGSVPMASTAVGMAGSPTTGTATTAPVATAPVATVPLVTATTVTASAVTATSSPLDTGPVGSLLVTDIVVLQRDGIGVVGFGDEPEAAIVAVNEVLGEPTDDTDWTNPFDISTCAGTEVRRVSWGALALYFGDESSIAQNTRHLFAYSYGAIDDLEAEPRGLSTPEQIGLGTPVEFLKAAYPDADVQPGEEGIVEANFYVDENLSGRLTGGADDDLVTLIIGGDPCGV